MDTRKAAALLTSPLRIVNLGLASFSSELTEAGATSIHVDWSPPARGNAKMAKLLAKVGS